MFKNRWILGLLLISRCAFSSEESDSQLFADAKKSIVNVVEFSRKHYGNICEPQNQILTNMHGYCTYLVDVKIQNLEKELEDWKENKCRPFSHLSNKELEKLVFSEQEKKLYNEKKVSESLRNELAVCKANLGKR